MGDFQNTLDLISLSGSQLLLYWLKLNSRFFI